MSKNKDAQAELAILEYLNKQNRPYSAIDIFNNLHKEYGKTAVVKALEALAQNGKISEKAYGKQKVYVADQSQFPVVDDGELKDMEKEISVLQEQLKFSDDKNRVMEAEVRKYSSSISTEDARSQLVQLQQQCSKLEDRLDSLKSNSNSVSPEERKKIMTNREMYVKAWRKRKRMAMEILNAILEGYPKSKKELFEEIGIETDEEYKVKPPDL